MLGKKLIIGASVGAAARLPLYIGAAHAAVDPGSGTHGCVVADANGTPAPTVYPNSGTSQIGGNTCTFTVVPGATVGGDAGYFAAAQTWSIVSCALTPAAGGGLVCVNDPKHSYSSGAGSPAVGVPPALVPGEVVTVTVHNGLVIAGTGNGSSGA
jgi:hypothetical protein